MTTNEKLKKINAACDLIREAMGELCEAQALMEQLIAWMPLPELPKEES